MERTVTEFNLRAQALDQSSENFKKELGDLVKNISKSFAGEGWKSFRKALYKRIPHYQSQNVSNSARGAKPKLSATEELQIVEWIIRRAEMNCPVDHSNLFGKKYIKIMNSF